MEAERTLPERTGEGFLTLEQQRRYGRYVDDPDQAKLDRYFHLDTAARELVDVRRGERNRLGKPAGHSPADRSFRGPVP